MLQYTSNSGYVTNIVGACSELGLNSANDMILLQNNFFILR